MRPIYLTVLWEQWNIKIKGQVQWQKKEHQNKTDQAEAEELTGDVADVRQRDRPEETNN